MAPVEIKSFVAYATNLIEALNIIYVNGAFGEVEFLLIIGMMFLKNIIASRPPVRQDLVVLLDFNVEVAKEPNQIFQNIPK